MKLVLFATIFSGAVQGAILVILLLKKRSLSNRLLAILVAAVACHLLLVALDVQDLFSQLPHLSRISWVLPLIYGPLLLLITLSIAKPGFRLRITHLALLLPVLTYLIILLPYFLMSTERKRAILADTTRVMSADFGPLNHITNYIHLFFISISLLAFYRERKSLGDYYSEYSRASLGWLRKFLWLIFSIILFSIFAFYSRKYQWESLPVLYPYHFLLIVGMIYWLAYHVVLHPVAFTPTENSDASKYSKTALSELEQNLIAGRLSTCMTQEKPYLDCELTINTLADQLQVKRHQLSQVINTLYARNFYEYINDFRIEEFKEKVEQHEHIRHSIIGLALDCGFKSKATFNAVFKKKENCTPSEYIRVQKGITLADQTVL